jgi:hypothetical protein
MKYRNSMFGKREGPLKESDHTLGRRSDGEPKG